MAENINIPIKVSGDTLSAIEFNQFVDKTNNMINEFNSASTVSQITWLTGQTKPTIDADVIIGELQEAGTHYITKYKSGNNDVAIINNINDLFSSYKTIKNTTLTDAPYIVKAQGDKFICLDYNYSKLFRLNADLSLDDTFSNEINDISSNEIYDFLVLNDNTILVTSYDTNNSISSMFKLDIDGNINQNFENTKIFNESLCLSSSSLVKTQSNGKIICCVYEDSYIPKQYIGRFNVDGSIDNTFNIILLSNSTVFTILNDDSIVYKFYDQPNNRYLLKKCNSEGIEDAAYAANFIDSGYDVYHILDLNESFTDGSMLFLENSFNNIIKINQDGTPNVEYSNNISTVNMFGYANIILHNNKLVTISFLLSEIGLPPKIDIVVIAENGIIESSVRLDGFGINIYESNNSYLITFYNYNEIYAYSQLYNSEFNPVFTTLVEKPHYALQKQLEYPIFTPNNYYIPAIINLQHEIALTAYVSGGEGSNYTYYNFNSETEEFDIRLTSQSSQFVYLNSFLFKITNDYYTSYEVFTYDLQEIPGLSIYGVNESYPIDAVIIGGGYDSNAKGITLSRMLVNGQNVIALANNSGQTIEWFDEITGAVVSNWSWSGITGTTENCCLFKISDTKVALSPIGNFNSLSLYICGILDLETKNYINLATDSSYYNLVVKYLNDSKFGIAYDSEHAEAKCVFPDQTEYINNTSYFAPVCILESMDEELAIGYNSNDYTIRLLDNKTENMDNTNLLSLVNGGLFQISHNFQNYDFYKLGDYYYLILNILGENGFALKSTDAKTWEIIIIGGNSDSPKT